ncbi:MAG: autotransporter-associated beta strand repeat-containing protein [Luteolibacter sp.]
MLLAAPFGASAATYQWDVNGASAGLGGSGAWDATSTFWDTTGVGADDGTDATAAVAAFTAADSAIFGGTPGTVTLGTAITVGSTQFTVPGYTLNLTNTAATTYALGNLTGTATINVSLGAGTTTATVGTAAGSLSGFTGTINVGVSQAAGSGKANFPSTVGGFPAGATVNLKANSSLYQPIALNYAAAINLEGGDTGESLGQLRLENNAIWSGPVTLTGAITGAGDAFFGSNLGTATISGDIGESGGPKILSKAGGGTIVLSGTNSVTGGTSVSGGTLTLDYSGTNTNKLSMDAPLTLGTATVRFSGNLGDNTAQVVKGLTLSGNGTIAADTVSGRYLTLDFSGNDTGTFNPGPYILTVTSSGTGLAQVKLPGTTPSTTFLPAIHYNGTFAATDSSNLLVPGSDRNSTGTNLSTWVSGATQYTTTGAAFTGSVGAISIDGITFQDAAARIVTLSGTTTLGKGVIVTPSVGGNVSTITGGTLQAPSGGTLTLVNANASSTLTIASAIADNSSTPVMKLGTGTLVLSGANTFAGGLTINAGRVNATNATNLGTGAITAGANTLYGAAYASGAAPFLAMTGTGDLTVPNNMVLPNAATTSYYALQKTTTGTLELSGVISGGGANTVLQLDSPTSGDSTTHFVLSGHNTLAGQVRLNRGCVTLATADALGSASLFVQTNANTTNGNVRFTNPITLPNNITINTGSDSINTNANNVELSGSIGGSATWIKLGSGKLLLSGISNSTGGITVNAGTLSVTGNGTVFANAYNTSVVTLAAGTVLELQNWGYDQTTAHTTSLGGLSANNTSIISNGATIRMFGTTSYNRGFTVNAGGVTLEAAAGADWTLSAGTGVLLPVYNSNPPLTLAGEGSGHFNKVFSGTGALTKNGTGLWSLAGANTYTGATTINAGKLIVDGSLANTAVEVKSGATLGGAGAIGGSVTVRTGGHQAFAVASLAASQVTRTITGSLTLESGTIIDLSAAGTVAPGTYVLATANGGITGTPATVNLPSGVSGSLAVSGNNLQLTVTGTAYDTWTASFSLSGADAAFDADPDHDGIKNGLEWILGGDPKASSASVVPMATLDVGGDLNFVFNRNPDSIGVADLVVEWDTDLSDGFAHSIGIGTVNVPPSGSNPAVYLNTPSTNQVTVVIPAANAVGGKLFARLKAAEN